MIYSTGFSYNNVHSNSKHIYKVRTTGGLSQDTFLADKNVNTVKLRNSHKSRIQSITKEPLVIPMALYFDENLNEETARGVKRWLETDNFYPLRFDDDPNRIYYATPNGAIPLTHNAISSGYVEFDMLTNSSYAFSDKVSIKGSSTSLSSPTIERIYNDGDINVAPEMKFVVNPTSPSIIEVINETTGDRLLIENNLENETVTVLNEYEEIHTTSNLQNKYENHNDVFIKLESGENVLRLTGLFTYEFTFQPVYL